MSELPSTQERPVTRRDPTSPLTAAHEALITMIAEIVVEDYLAELAEEDIP